jgi:hypothetical protein
LTPSSDLSLWKSKGVRYAATMQVWSDSNGQRIKG